ncbi:MAG: phosphomannomutase, partial [Desulfovibrio sp.]|nr:phosphomannomutase [Desulfovibrio sp.]
MTHDLSCFKAYDIRGRVPDVLNPALARALGQAVAEVPGTRSVVLGRDARLSGPELRDALAQGLLAAGARVTDLGLCGTEEIYYAAANQPFDAGIMITGSHNPADENGFKLVRAGAVPVSADSGLRELKERVARLLETQIPQHASVSEAPVNVRQACFRPDYLNWLLDYSGARELQTAAARPLKIVADAGNGCAGLVL